MYVASKNPMRQFVTRTNLMKLGVSHYSRGTQMHQVWNEITFPGENEDIILHDSGGFEAGNETGFEEIKKFIHSRLSAVDIADQLHCIWRVTHCSISLTSY